MILGSVQQQHDYLLRPLPVPGVGARCHLLRLLPGSDKGVGASLQQGLLPGDAVYTTSLVHCTDRDGYINKAPSFLPVLPALPQGTPPFSSRSVLGAEMMNIVGSPGTRAGLALRVSQFVFAIGSAVAMAFSAYSYFVFRVISYQMPMLSTWSFTLGCIDIISLKKNWDLHNTDNVWMYLIGDWALAIVSLATVSSAGGVAILLDTDIKYCSQLSQYSSLACSPIQVSVILGSIAWALTAASAVSTFWLLVALYN